MTFFEFSSICKLRETWSTRQIEEAKSFAKSDGPNAKVIYAVLQYIEKSGGKSDKEKTELLKEIYIDHIVDRDNIPDNEKIKENQLLFQKKALCENCGCSFTHFGRKKDVIKCPKCGTTKKLQ